MERCVREKARFPKARDKKECCFRKKLPKLIFPADLRTNSQDKVISGLSALTHMFRLTHNAKYITQFAYFVKYPYFCKNFSI